MVLCNEPKLLFLYLVFIDIKYSNDYVTDVVVTWSGVIDHLYYFIGLMLSQWNVYCIGYYVMNQCLSDRCSCHMV